MSKGRRTRKTMIEAAAHLFQANGYSATGLKSILEASGAPRGSLYFHFPGGKEELAVEVISAHRAAFGAQMESATQEAASTLQALNNVLDLLAQLAEATGCAAGCPVGFIAAEMAIHSKPLRDATRETFDEWSELVSSRLVADGWPPAEAKSRARMVISAIEGALVVCRAYGDAGPLRDIRASLPALLTPPQA